MLSYFKTQDLSQESVLMFSLEAFKRSLKKFQVREDFL